MARKPYITWNFLGKASEVIHCEEKCAACKWHKYQKTVSTDDYGSLAHCNVCSSYGGNGTRRWLKYKRRPEYDAPTP